VIFPGNKKLGTRVAKRYEGKSLVTFDFFEAGDNFCVRFIEFWCPINTLCIGCIMRMCIVAF